MNDLVAYRDDGPLASPLGSVSGRAAALSAPLVTLAGAVVLAAGLVSADAGVPRVVLGLSTAVYVLLAGLVAGREPAGRLDWLVPPLLRVAEYGTLLVLALLADPGGPDAVPACFALVAVLAYNHYNATYRLRHQRAAPPRWLRLSGGGWDVRLLVAFALFAVGRLAVGMYIAAGILAVLYATETVLSWRRFSHARRPALYEEEDDEHD